MNRRNFIKGILTAAAGFSILPSAMTYRRTWKEVSGVLVPNPEWVNAEYDAHFMWNPCVLICIPERPVVPIIYRREVRP